MLRMVSLQMPAKLMPTHLRHIDVSHNNIRIIVQCLLKALFAIRCLNRSVSEILKFSHDDLSKILLIFYDKYFSHV